MNEETKQRLLDFLLDSPMKTEIAKSDDEANLFIEKHKALGNRLASVSNAGLSANEVRFNLSPRNSF